LHRYRHGLVLFLVPHLVNHTFAQTMLDFVHMIPMCWDAPRLTSCMCM